MAPPKLNPAAAAGNLASQSAKPLGRFVEFTSRVIPVTSALALRFFKRAHAIGFLPKLGRARLRALIQPFRKVLADTGLSGRLGIKNDTELFFQIRKWMGEGGALEASDKVRFLAEYGGRENYVLGKLLEEFLGSLEELQLMLLKGAEAHRDILNHALKTGGEVVDGLNRVVKALPEFGSPMAIRSIKRTIIDQNGAIREVQFFDKGFASRSKTGDWWSIGSGQEIKTPGVAGNISEQVSLRDPRIGESILIEFEYQTSNGNWKKKLVNPEQLVTVPGSLVSVGLTVQGSRSNLMSVSRSELKSILEAHSQIRIVGRGNRQRFHVVFGVPISNFRAVIRAAIKP